MMKFCGSSFQMEFSKKRLVNDFVVDLFYVQYMDKLEICIKVLLL